MTRLMISIAVAGLLAAAAAPARAGGDTVMYKVRTGDSLELIAAEYYGDRNHAVFIMTANKMEHPRKLKPGERLKIPITRDITTSAGDTFTTLATTYLDDGRRAPFLAEFNGLDAADTLPAGSQLTIPFHVSHTAAGDETIASIAAAYFGDAKNAGMLRDYNFLDKTTLAKGETIVIPIHNVRVRASKVPAPDPDSKARTAKLEQTRILAKTALPRARKAAARGDYGGVNTELADIDLDFVDADVAVEVGMLLGEALIASDNMPIALATYRRVIKRKPGLVLGVYYYSPRVREAWKKAGGAVESDK